MKNADTRRPNILVLFTDQHRWDALGCTGGWVSTPRIDAIAANGAVFLQCFTTAPVCVPARLSLATGLYPHNIGVWANVPVALSAAAPTWMQTLRECGYRTSLFGKCHLHPHDGVDLRDREHLLRAYGFDDVDEVPGPRAATYNTCRMTDRWARKGVLEAYRCDMRSRERADVPQVRPSPLDLDDYYDTYVARSAASYLRAYDCAEPWFCWVGFPGPHEPWDAPEPFASLYRPEDMPTPIRRPPWLTGRSNPTGGWLHSRMRRRFANISAEMALRLRADYAGSISLIDKLVGEVLDAVQQKASASTVVVFSADHGEMAGDFGLLHKSVMLDPAIRVPLIVSDPDPASDFSRGGRFSCPVELIDIGTTLLELAKTRSPHVQFGRSLVPVLRGSGISHRGSALIEHRRESTLVESHWKITTNAAGKPYLLFDRKQDPHEENNLVGNPAYRRVGSELLERLAARLSKARLPGARKLVIRRGKVPNS